jgi:outer membrane lipoprotein LolB
VSRGLAVALLALAGCAQAPSLPTPVETAQESSWENHRADVLALDRWSFDGRVAVQRGDQGWNAGLRWRQYGDEFELRITAPLGRGTFRLAGDSDQVELTDPKGGIYRARDVEALMDQHLNWYLPLSGARYWVVGAPSRTSPVESIRTDQQGLLKDLTQAGWRISVLRYLTENELELPGKLFMSYGDVQVRMVIAAWKIGGP